MEFIMINFRIKTHIAAVAVLIVCLAVCAIMVLMEPVYAASDFIIRDYGIDMQVNEDDTYLITETIDVHFTAPSHGIYRTIPYRVKLDRDGQKSEFYGRVRDFQMLTDQPVSKTKGDTEYFFRIGSAGKYADEDTTYQFSYVFDMRGDHLKDADEVYYNLIGTYWEAQDIEHVSFQITFPEPVDMNNVGMKTGSQVDVPFEDDGGKTIWGETDEDTLRGLTIRAVLPEGYFTKQAGSSNLPLYVLVAIIAAVTLWGAMIWRRYGKDPDIVETVQFYPPEGLSAAEVGYLDNGEVKGEHVTSMLLELADKGFISISEKEVRYGEKKDKISMNYEIRQLKEYDGDSEDEKLFMEGLFNKGRRKMVRASTLKNHFYETVQKIEDNIYSRFRGKLWDDKADTYSWILRGLGLLGMILLFIVSKVANGSPFIPGNGDFLIYCVFDLLEIVLPIVGFYGISNWINKPRKNLLSFIIGFVGWAALIIIGFSLAVLFDTCMGAQVLAYLSGLAMIFLLYFMAALCERKSDYYAGMLGKIRGYKNFLKMAEKDRMETLAEQDPDYFYKNLAFAFALGVTAVYAEHFASLATAPPSWYAPSGTGPVGAFTPSSMMDSVNSMMSTVGSNMTSSSSGSSSGGSSSGGGSFSGGGGAGGGGGGSW